MKSDNLTKFYITRPFNFADVQQVAKLHACVFPDYFLTHMGLSFLELFYQQFIERPGYGVIASVDNTVVGFATGTTDASLLYKRFYKKHFLKLFAITVTKIIVDPIIRNSILSRAFHIKKAVHSVIPFIFSTNRQSSQKVRTSTSKTRLLSIGVDPNFRGMGIAEEITDKFCEQLRLDGVTVVGLSVLNNNPRAIQFYKKSGWQVEFSNDNSTYFIRST